MPSAGNVTRLRWLVPLLVVVAALTVGSGLLARQWYGSAPSTGERETAPSSSRTSVPRQQPGSPVVRLARSASQHPEGDEVRALLQDYFNAINQRDYKLWTTTVVGKWAHNKPAGEWLRSYSSTKDGNIVLYRLQALGDRRLRAFVAFTSTQDPQDAPVTLPVRCIRWHLALPVVRVGGQWRLDQGPPGLTPVNARCE